MSSCKKLHRVPDPLNRGDKVRITRLRRDLLDWYNMYGRTFPWRAPSASIFEKICVEVLLQRTRAEVVASFYEDFFGAFPSWQKLADAPLCILEEKLKPIGLWQRRALSLKNLATYATLRDGLFPDTEVALTDVPAVGQYVANAILLFQHGKARPLLDVNMARVIERFIRPRRLADIRYDPWLQEAALWLVRGEMPAELNWAVLDFAGTICVSRTPHCGSCFLLPSCSFARR